MERIGNFKEAGRDYSPLQLFRITIYQINNLWKTANILSDLATSSPTLEKAAETALDVYRLRAVLIAQFPDKLKRSAENRGIKLSDQQQEDLEGIVNSARSAIESNDPHSLDMLQISSSTALYGTRMELFVANYFPEETGQLIQEGIIIPQR